MLVRGRRSAAALAALVCASVALTACDPSETLTGGDDSGTRQGKEAVAVVQKFAEASGPEACDLFTPNALRNVYGGEEAVGQPAVPIEAAPPQYAVDNCREAAPKFEGEKVEIDKVDVVGDRAVKIQAALPGSADAEDRLFDVTLRRKGDAYLIDEIREK